MLKTTNEAVEETRTKTKQDANAGVTTMSQPKAHTSHLEGTVKTEEDDLEVEEGSSSTDLVSLQTSSKLVKSIVNCLTKADID